MASNFLVFSDIIRTKFVNNSSVHWFHRCRNIFIVVFMHFIKTQIIYIDFIELIIYISFFTSINSFSWVFYYFLSVKRFLFLSVTLFVQSFYLSIYIFLLIVIICVIFCKYFFNLSNNISHEWTNNITRYLKKLRF